MDRLRLFLLLSVLGLGACDDSTTTTVTVTPTTAIAVDPAEFLGNAKCGGDAGDSMLQYVATLSDVSPQGELGIEGTWTDLPSSVPTSCHVKVLFTGVIDGREYEAKVDGYDRTDIEPLAKGNPTMVVSGTGAYAAPRWTTRCAHNRLPPSLRNDAGAAEYADGGYPTDGGYAQCRPVVVYGPHNAPWLEGPVCALNLATITARGCDPLTLVP